MNAARSAVDFMLVKGQTVRAAVSAEEPETVRIALDLLKRDLANVLDATLEVVSDGDADIVAGTAGSPLLKPYFDGGKLKKDDRKEAFQLAVVNEAGRVRLLIAGSDKRGAAYGVVELTRMLGVSPYEWWADVTPEKRDSFTLPETFSTSQAPSVEYRGIFVNDEDWGFTPWAARTFEPEAADLVDPEIARKTPQMLAVGPKTHAKIFELLLRLKANTFWPAMHSCTVPFYMVKGNAEAADRYGIVIGTSHCEPMHCNVNGEWRLRGEGEYNYLSNRDNVLRFFEDRLAEAGRYENIYTIGMRGVHDGRMNGAVTLDEQREILSKVIADQRAIIEKHSGKKAERVPQIFVPYKEVLDVYRTGLKVPEDVTLMWCDDNRGYLLRLSDGEELKRSGGAGVYYHVSYWGVPQNYLWLATNHPGLLYREMKRAYDRGAKKIWILNVGDIKPQEMHMELFLDMAWDVGGVERTGVQGYLEAWCARTFGADAAKEAASILAELYRISWIRKAEFMCSESGDPGPGRAEPTVMMENLTPGPDFSEREALEMIADYDALEKRTLELGKRIPAGRRSAWFEIVEYQVRGSAGLARKHLYAMFARAGMRPWADVHEQHQLVQALTARFDAIEGGKWRRMLYALPCCQKVFDDIREPWELSPRSEVFAADRMKGLVACFDALDADGVRLTPAFGMGYRARAAIIPGGQTVNYGFTLKDAGRTVFRVNMVPTHPVNGDRLRCEIVLDGKAVAEPNIHAKDFSDEWSENVIRNRTSAVYAADALAAGEHTLSIRAVDEEIILDTIEITQPG